MFVQIASSSVILLLLHKFIYVFVSLFVDLHVYFFILTNILKMNVALGFSSVHKWNDDEANLWFE